MAENNGLDKPKQEKYKDGKSEGRRSSIIDNAEQSDQRNEENKNKSSSAKNKIK